jgi:hypothetical protein
VEAAYNGNLKSSLPLLTCNIKFAYQGLKLWENQAKIGLFEAGVRIGWISKQ